MKLHTINILIIFKRQMSQKKYHHEPVTDKGIIPLTIYQISNMLLSDSAFESQPYENVSFLGRLQCFSKKDTSALLLFCDGTGQIQCRINILDGKMSSFAQDIPFLDKFGVYFFVILKPMFNQEGKRFNIVGIKQITNYNFITKQISDVVLGHLIRVKK